jgi:tRNA pseudouridine13 synthase
LKEVEFTWKREKPEDFIVREVSEFEMESSGNFFLYLLAKRNLTTREICKKFNLSYAGMKDRFALTFQKVSSEKFLGDYYEERLDETSWFKLKFLGRVRKKVKIGQLKGNKFAINVENLKIKKVSAFINYYDIQRISKNWERGKEILEKLIEKPKKRLSWSQNFLIDSYLSYLWNKSLEEFLKEKFSGYYVTERGEKFFIPDELKVEKLPKFWTVLGYKKKLLNSEIYYRRVLEREGWKLEEILELLKKLGIKGDYRMTYIVPREIKRIGNYLFFFLPKGAFATMLLKHAIVE